MNHKSLPLILCAVVAVLLPSCVTQIPAHMGEAKLRTAPRNFNRPGPVILVERVDGQVPREDKRDSATTLMPGPHVVALKTFDNQQGQPGELIMLLARAFAPPPPPPPQKVHQFFAENGHDYFIRWAWSKQNGAESIWIEDYTRRGQVVSGMRPYDAMPMRDPFAK